MTTTQMMKDFATVAIANTVMPTYRLKMITKDVQLVVAVDA